MWEREKNFMKLRGKREKTSWKRKTSREEKNFVGRVKKETLWEERKVFNKDKLDKTAKMWYNIHDGSHTQR